MSKNTCKRCKQVSVIIISAVILALGIEVLVYNHSILKLPKEKRQIETVNLSNLKKVDFKLDNGRLVTTGKDNSVQVNFKGQHVQSINIHYVAKNDFKAYLSNEQIGAFDKKSKTIYESSNSAKLNILSKVINSKSYNMKIEFKGEPITITKIEIDNSFALNAYRILFFSLLGITLGIIVLFRKKFSTDIEKGFVIIALVIGVLIVIITPVSNMISVDSETHFQRTNEFFQSKGRIWTESEALMKTPTSFPRGAINSRTEMTAQNQYLNKNDSRGFEFVEKAGYPKYTGLGYIPSALVLKITGKLGVPFVASYKLGKLANLIFYLTIMYFAIRIIPVKKRLLCIFALIPVNLWMASNYSLDPIITSCITLGIALFIREYLSKEKVSIKSIAIFCGVMAFGIIGKAVYAPFVLLALLFGKDRYKNYKQARIIKIFAILVCSILMVTIVLPIVFVSDGQSVSQGVGDINPSQQMHLIMNHLSDYINVLLNNAGTFFLKSFFGQDGISLWGYLSFLPLNIYFSFLLLLIAFAAKTNVKKVSDLDLKFSVSILSIILVIVVMVWSALYITYNPVGATMIDGVQGRYFLPLLFPLLLSIGIYKDNEMLKKTQYNNKWVFVLLLVTLLLFRGVYTNILSVTAF